MLGPHLNQVPFFLLLLVIVILLAVPVEHSPTCWLQHPRQRENHGKSTSKSNDENGALERRMKYIYIWYEHIDHHSFLLGFNISW